MKRPAIRRAIRWSIIVLLLLAVPVVMIGFLWNGMANPYLRRVVVTQLSRLTGGQVSLREFHFNPGRLLVTLDDLTIHGREVAGAPPFFHADKLSVGLRIDSLWNRKVSVGDVDIVHPEVYVRLARDGSSNVPAPPRARTPGKPIRQRLFEIVVRKLQLEDGQIIFNDEKIPLVAAGGRLDFTMDYSEAENRRMYLGDFRWNGVRLTAKRYMPFSADVLARFTLEPDSISVTQVRLSLPHTSLDAQLSLTSFERPSWNFRYRGQLNLDDIRAILRKPKTPGGHIEFGGGGTMADGRVQVNGDYSASGITLRDQWFHAGGMSSRGTYHADRDRLEVPVFTATGLGGGVSGRVQLQFHGMQFRVDAHAQGMSLAAVLAAVNNPSLPVTPLHWESVVEVQSVVTWINDFKQVDSSGIATWAAPAAPPQGLIPVSAHLNYHYNMLQQGVALQSSEIDTPTSRIQVDGRLAAHATGLAVTFDTQDLMPWDDFINRLRGENAEPKLISGSAHWQGSINGPLAGPAFTGHVRGTNARYDQLLWDEIEGDMTYSPEGFTFARASARRGRSSAQMEMSLTLDNWSFRPDSPWNFDATLVRTEMGGLQSLLGYSFPASGLLSGEFHGKGTREDPTLNGLFDVISPQAWNWKFDRVRGELFLRHGEVRVSNAELRLLPPPVNGTTPQTAAVPGVLTGNLLFNTLDREVVFDLTGAALPLEGIAALQTPRLPMGGRLSFQLAGQGPLLAPKMGGSLRLVDLRLGSEVVGSFQGQVNSDGQQLTLTMDSAMKGGSLHGTAQVALRGAYPISSQIDLAQIDLDPLLAAALHLGGGMTGHGQVDGRLNVSGALLDPQTLSVDANFSHMTLSYEYVKLENQGPVRLQYGHSAVSIQQADLRGVDTDFHIAGFARFAGDRSLGLQVGGEVNLRLFSAFVPNLSATGPAQVDAGIQGTLSNPRITGRVHVQGADLRFGDFPTGLSQVAGDFVFNANRLTFDNVKAQAGGGNMTLAGSLSYGNGPLRYDLSARSEQVRIRYPAGMSWLAGGALQLTGSTQAATLSGNVVVDRLLMADNFDLASLLTSSTETAAAPGTNSSFFRNLQFDVQASASPNARLQWSSGASQAEASLRIRGTWDRPILLGNIHLLDGDMRFRGNTYRLDRGDINFVNPFRLDPVMDIEATTKIRQYEVTIDFSGAASHLTMSYRSDPPLPSSDVFTLLALGSTGEESQLRGAAAVASPELGATTLLSEAISSQLGGRVQRLFGISHFSVDPAYLSETAVGTNPAARVTIQQQFARNLTITYSTDVNSTQQEVIQFEYTVRPDLSIVALRDENGTFGIDVIRKKRFK